MECMNDFLRSCLKNMDLDTVTKADLKKMYLEAKGLNQFSKEDKKLFSEAVKIALESLSKKQDISDIEAEIETKEEDTKEKVLDDEKKENQPVSDSDDDFSLADVKKSTDKSKSSRKVLSDSEMSAEDGDLDVKKPSSKEINTETKKITNPITDEDSKDSSVDFSKKTHSSLSEDDDNSKESVLMVQKKKKSQMVTSDDESTPKRKNSGNGQKRQHVSSNSENDKLSSGDESSSETNTPKRKKRKLSKSTKNEKSGKSVLNLNMMEENLQSDETEWTLRYSSGSDEEIHTEQPIKMRQDYYNDSNGCSLENTTEQKSIKNDYLETDLVTNIQSKSNVLNDDTKSNSNCITDSEDEPLMNLSNQKSINSLKSTEKFETSKDFNCFSGIDNEPLANVEKSNSLNDSDSEPLANLINQSKKTSVISRKVRTSVKLNQKHTKESTKHKIDSDSEDEPLMKFVKKKRSLVTRSIPKKGKVNRSLEDEPLINLVKRNSKVRNGTTNVNQRKNNNLKRKQKNALNSAKNIMLASNDSEDEPLANLFKKTKHDTSEEEDIPLASLWKNSKRDTCELEDEPLANLVKKEKHSLEFRNGISNMNKRKNNNLKRKQKNALNSAKNVMLASNDSEDEPLANLFKKTKHDTSEEEDLPLASLWINSKRDTSESEDEPLANLAKKEKHNLNEAEDLPLANLAKNTKHDASESEDGPLANLAKNLKHEVSDAKEEHLDKNTKDDLSELEDEPLENLTINHLNDLKGSNGISASKSLKVQDLENIPLAHKEKNSPTPDSDLENEPLTKLKKQKTAKSKKSVLINRKANSSSEIKSVNYQNMKAKKKSYSQESCESPRNVLKLITNTMHIEEQNMTVSEEITANLKKKLNKRNVIKDRYLKSEVEPISCKDSEDETLDTLIKRSKQPLQDKKKSAKISKKSKSSKNKIVDSSDSEDEIGCKPLKKGKKSSTKPASNRQVVSESENESMASSAKQVTSEASSDSENEPLAVLGKSKKLLESSKGSPEKDASGSGSDDEPLTHFSKKNSTAGAQLKDGSAKKINSSIDSEDEPLSKLPQKKNVKDSIKMDTSESEEEPLASLSKKKFNGTKNDESDEQSSENEISNSKSPKLNSSSDSEDEPIIKLKKKNNKSAKTVKDKPLKKSGKSKNMDWSDSDDEPLETSAKKSLDESSKTKESSSSSVDENEEQSPLSKKKNTSKKEKDSNSVKEKKRPSASENKIENLKKYVRAAGIRVQNYTKLFKDCKSMKDKMEKLIDLLESHGLKGKPTLEKCKKLKKKNETKKEVAELDLSNILKTEGRRPKRGACSDATNCEKQEGKAQTPVKRFSRLQDIVDSEESD